MPKLNQIIAIEKGTKTKVNKLISVVHHKLTKKDLFSGHARTFKPVDDDPTKPTGEKIPQDIMKVKYRVSDLINEAKNSWTELFNVTAMRDYGNTIAKADVIIDDKTILSQVPVSVLLFLEKQLDDLNAFMSKLPSLDPGEEWEYDPNQDMFSTKPSESIKYKRVTRPLVLYDATERHPAQVKEITEDILHGMWNTIKYSTALKTQDINKYVERVEKLRKAVKFAREDANSQELSKKDIGGPIFNYIFE